LAGIATALAATRSSWNLIVACDLPYLSAAWLDWLLSRAIRSRGQVVIPRTRRGLEPLASVYRRECSSIIASALARGARKVTDVLEELRMDVVDQREWRRLDPRALVLKNMNTPKDYAEARKWWGVEALRESHSIKKPRRERAIRPRAATVQSR
jgi:molybdopterin-guanine dinucleotide biosynthesis protein A